MSETEAMSTEIVHRLTDGVIVERDDVETATFFLGRIEEEKTEIGRVEAALKDLVREWYATHGGPQTIRHQGVKVTLGSGEETLYDAQALEAALREAGMPETSIRDIIVETISYKVDATKAKQAAKANPVYAAAVDACSTKYSKTPSVSVKRERTEG